MKKEDVTSLIVYILMLVIALLIGLLVIRNMFESVNQSSLPTGNSFLFTFLVIVIGLIFNVVMLEVGHVLGGLIGGYSIVSFNVLGLCLSKKKGKWHFGVSNFDGLTGETKLAPKSDKASLRAYIWIPLLFYVLGLAVAITFYSIGTATTDPVSPWKWVAIASIVMLTIGSMIALYNFIPAKLDSMTDGYRLVLISKKVNVQAYNELMRIENLQREGKEVTDIMTFDVITDFSADINLISVYVDLGKGDFKSAEVLIDKMLVDPKSISTTTRDRLIAQKLYIQIMTKTVSDARKYYDESVDDPVRRFISNDLSMESLRAYVLIAGLLDDSQGEVSYANSRKNKALKRAMPSRVEVEKKLYDDALNKVISFHKDWEIK